MPAFFGKVELKKTILRVLRKRSILRKKKSQGDGVLFFFGAGLLLFLIYEIIPDSGDQKNKKAGSKSVALLTELIGIEWTTGPWLMCRSKLFGVCSFSTLRMVEEVGMPKIISNELLARVPFLEDMVWDPVECGVQPNGRALFTLPSCLPR